MIMEVETMNGRPELHMAVRRRPKSVDAGLAYSLCRLFARSVGDVQRRCSCRLWRYIIAFTFYPLTCTNNIGWWQRHECVWESSLSTA